MQSDSVGLQLVLVVLYNIFHAKTEIVLDKQPENAFYPDLITIDNPDRIALEQLYNAEELIPF